MNGSIPADATESAHRRGDSGTADAADAVGAARDAAEAGGTASGVGQLDRAPVPSPARPVRGRQRNRTGRS